MYHPAVEKLLKSNEAFKKAFNAYGYDKMLGASNALTQANKNPCCNCMLDHLNRTQEACLLCWFGVARYDFHCKNLDSNVSECVECPCFGMVQDFRTNILMIS
jgi:hypothetical protein